jgi:transcriptional regulator with XRE-family HTH domain
MLATAVGVERNTVARWENGSMLPRDPAVIAALSRTLNVSADWILGDLVPDHPGPSSEAHEQPMQPYRARLGDAESLPPQACDLTLY